MAGLPIKQVQQLPKVQNKVESVLTSIVNTFQDVFKGFSDSITGDGYKKTKILRVEQKKHEEYLKTIAFEINKINEELNNVRKFNFNSKKLFEQSSEFMSRATIQIHEFENLRDKLSLKFDDLSYLEHFNEVKQLLYSNKKDYSVLLITQKKLLEKHEEQLFSINSLEQEINLTKDHTKRLEFSMNENKENINESSVEFTEITKQQKRDMRILFADQITIERNLSSKITEVNDKNKTLEERIDKYKLWLIILSAFVLIFSIVNSLINFL